MIYRNEYLAVFNMFSIQPACKKCQENAFLKECQMTTYILQAKKFVEITLSHTVYKNKCILCIQDGCGTTVG